jgi:hypothetical protein
MYDIKIFIENDWSFWWRINTWKEIIYWVWKTQQELINSLKDGLEIAYEKKLKNESVIKISSFLSFNQEDKYAVKV